MLQLKMEDAVRCVENYLYTFIYYASLMFGTCRMTIASKTHQIVSYAISLLWCLAIVGNQIDYVMKPWTEERKETRKEDTTFEKIVRLDVWTYNATCLLSCSFPLIGRKAELKVLNDLQTSRNKSTRDAWRMAIVVFFIVANAMPAIFSYDDFPDVQKKDDSAYNSLFQDVCKLGTLTADLQFVWFCWCLGDGFAGLNERLLRTADDSGRAYDFVKTDRTRSKHFESDEMRRADAAYRTLAEGAKTVNGVCGAPVLANVLCYMFNTICGLFNTISAHRTPGTPVAVHLLRAANCAGRVTLVCVAASSVADQDERLHDSAQTAREAFGGDCTEMKRFLRRLTYCKVKFNVCGMVMIDKTFLSSAVISVISYLVIVLQYNYS